MQLQNHSEPEVGIGKVNMSVFQIISHFEGQGLEMGQFCKLT